jgi:hypothetical protein
MTELNIYQRINAVMKDCDYIQKKGAAQGKGVKYDEVMAMIRNLLIKHGIVMVVRQSSMEQFASIDGSKQKVYQGSYEMDLVNIDNPTDKVTHSAFAHGMDGGDKAPGKAHTYAVKIMLVKGFGIETGEDEESRAEKIERQMNQLTHDQHDQLAKYCLQGEGGNTTWSLIGQKVAGAYNLSVLFDLPAQKFDEVLKRCVSFAEKANGNN